LNKYLCCVELFLKRTEYSLENKKKMSLEDESNISKFIDSNEYDDAALTGFEDDREFADSTDESATAAAVVMHRVTTFPLEYLANSQPTPPASSYDPLDPSSLSHDDMDGVQTSCLFAATVMTTQLPPPSNPQPPVQFTLASDNNNEAKIVNLNKQDEAVQNEKDKSTIIDAAAITESSGDHDKSATSTTEVDVQVLTNKQNQVLSVSS
jgi:hypothetical protein